MGHVVLGSGLSKRQSASGVLFCAVYGCAASVYGSNLRRAAYSYPQSWFWADWNRASYRRLDSRNHYSGTALRAPVTRHLRVSSKTRQIGALASDELPAGRARSQGVVETASANLESPAVSFQSVGDYTAHFTAKLGDAARAGGAAQIVCRCAIGAPTAHAKVSPVHDGKLRTVAITRVNHRR